MFMSTCLGGMICLLIFATLYMQVLLHLSHVRVTHDYLATNDSKFVSLFAHLIPLDGIW